MRTNLLHLWKHPRNGTPRCRSWFRSYLIAILLINLVFMICTNANAASWLRVSGIVFYDRQWIVADAGTGELLAVQSTDNNQSRSLGVFTAEPVALATDGSSLFCFDRREHCIVKMNRRLEVVEKSVLPDGSRNRLLPFLTVTLLGDRICVDRDESRLLAFDTFGNESWQVPIPDSLSVTGIASAKETIFLLCRSSHSQLVLTVSRFGSVQRTYPMSTVDSVACIFSQPDGSVYALTNTEIVSVDDSGVRRSIDRITDPIIAASYGQNEIGVVTAKGFFTLPWRD